MLALCKFRKRLLFFAFHYKLGATWEFTNPGHLVQHCPTDGVPEFDVKRVKPLTGIPKSVLMPTPEGLYALPSGAVAVLRPNEAAFEKEIEGLPSNRPVGDLPPELHCPMCKEAMKDAVLTSKCCFTSFCNKQTKWRDPQDLAMENYMMPIGSAVYNPYWNGMQPGMEGFLPSFGGPMPPFMGYGPGPLDVPFGLLPQDPFGVPNMMMPPPPFPPQRDLADMGIGMNVGPPMSREEFEARKADMRRNLEME